MKNGSSDGPHGTGRVVSPLSLSEDEGNISGHKEKYWGIALEKKK
jgi:hypothetical protein